MNDQAERDDTFWHELVPQEKNQTICKCSKIPWYWVLKSAPVLHRGQKKEIAWIILGYSARSWKYFIYIHILVKHATTSTFNPQEVSDVIRWAVTAETLIFSLILEPSLFVMRYVPHVASGTKIIIDTSMSTFYLFPLCALFGFCFVFFT